MASSDGRLRLFTVVDVWRGMAVGARNFRKKENAQRYLQRLRRQRKLAEDDVQLFETAVHLSPSSLRMLINAGSRKLA